ncbi:MAG: DUF1553 domain-containing protein [Bryobacteraceae bacterium]
MVTNRAEVRGLFTRPAEGDGRAAGPQTTLRRLSFRFPAVVLFFTAALLLARAAPADSGSVAPVKFNRDIRPIFSDKCFACHGPDAATRQAGLRFDTEAGARAELPSKRQALVPGDLKASELYRRVSSDNKAVRMPPAYAGHERLTDTEIELIRRWIEEGAKWEKHWSFIAPERPALPEVTARDWTRNPIDYFVLDRLEREGLSPSPEADRPTLIRRVTLDLTGLPPTPEEVDAFVADDSKQAYEKVVDRLLASPRYAERMAIRWLEGARYADTNGYQTDGERSMWRWRDWVIKAFDRNMPFDQFTIEQIAGDMLPNATLDQKIASAYHRNHRTTSEGGIVEEEFRVEYVADRVETTSTVWLGLTVGCARCHDHKYDPITQKEFYQLFAYFNNVPERGLVYNFGNEEPLIKAPTAEHSRKLAELDRKLDDSRQAWEELQPKISKLQTKWEKKIRKSDSIDWTVTGGQVVHEMLDGGPGEKVTGCKGDCSLPVVDGRIGKARGFDGQSFIDAGDVGKFNYLDPFTMAAWIKAESGDGAILSRAEDYLEGEGYGLFLMDGKLRLHVTRRWTDISLRVETAQPVALNEWQHVMVTYDGRRKSAGVKMYVNGKPQELKVLFDELTYPFGPKEPFRIGAGGGEKYRFRGLIDDVRVYDTDLSPEQAAVVPVLETVNEIAASPRSSRAEGQAHKLRFCYLEKFAPEKIQQARQRLEDATVERERYYDSIPTVMVMKEREEPRETFVLKRGAYDAHGEKVSPGVPSILPPLSEGAPNNRLGLAKWLVDRSNPLTARVMVNRFWQRYFGYGLVKTVEDFGSQGEWPIHQDLLDWLATEFMDNGWDMKALQKTIVMSATYRQSSRVTPELLKRDPENRLYARGPRVRLPAEMIRDQALAVSGLLVEELGGPSVKPYQPPGLWQELAGGKGYERDEGDSLYRRSLYTYWKRTVAPPSMITFDSPTRETCIVRSNRTNTPLQALNLMNDVTYVEASRKMAERMMTEAGPGATERIVRGYRLVLGRAPKPKEREVLMRAFGHFEKRYAADREAALELLSEGGSPRNESLDPSELAAYASVASLILNLDEAITKE